MGKLSGSKPPIVAPAKYSYVALLFLLCACICVVGVTRADQYTVELLDEQDGFNTSIIFSIVQDTQGFMWFGTAYEGVIRFDGENVVNYRRSEETKYSLQHNESGNLVVDKQGRIWIGGWGSSVTMLDPISNEVHYHPHVKTDENTVSDSYIQELFTDQQGHIWFGGRAKGLTHFDPVTETFTRFPYYETVNASSGMGTSHGRIWAIAQIAEDALWIGTEYGLNRLDRATNNFEYFIPDNQLGPSGINKIRHIYPLSDTRFLLGTHDGLLLFDLQTQSFSRLESEVDNPLGPIYSIIRTNFGQFWVATGKGVFYLSKNDISLKKVPLGIDDSCALTLFQDKQNIIWMSCEGRGVYKIVPQTFFKTLSHPIAKSAYSLKMANDGNLLIGTEADGIYKWDLQSDQLSPVSSDTGVMPSVNRLTQDASGKIWFTDNYQFYMLGDDGTAVNVIPPPGTPNPEKLTSIIHIMEASDGRVWVGTADGLFVVTDLQTPFKYYNHSPSDPTSLSHPSVTEIYEDRQGRIWLGTGNGLNLWHPDKDQFSRFEMQRDALDNQPDLNIYAIYQDQQQRVWAGTNRGLLYVDETRDTMFTKGVGDFSGSLGVRIIKGDGNGNLWMVTQVGVLKYNPVDDTLREFDESDGLSGARYFVNLATQSDDGTIFISSRDGIHYFDPSLVNDYQLTSKTVLTNFEVLGLPGESNPVSIQGQRISLAPDENYVRFEFSTLDLLNARQIRYLYKLEGLDDEWIDNGTSNAVVYTNLRGGEYQFKVRPILKNNLLYEEELAVEVSIATPIWQQSWMLVLYVLILLLCISYYIRYRQARSEREIQRQKRFVSELEFQVAKKTQEIRQESEKLASANRVKSQFLANMSHEIRTPLTAIIGLSESIIQGDVKGNEITGEVDRIHNQSRHLLSLLNDILDVTKIEENKFELEPYNQDMHELLADIEDMFVTQAHSKGLEFSIVKHLPGRFVAHIDGLRFKQVLINLISNALKFTEQGHVTIIVSQQQEQLLVNVIDTGIGMSKDHLDKVFQVFTQADSSINRRFGGSGLGLALSQKLVSMMGGELRVSSELNKGSVFTFSIPVSIKESAAVANKPVNVKVETLPKLQGEILLAEDHPDNRRFISRLFERLGLTVTTAINGIEAIELYKKSQPDLILLDIQMPQKDGIQTFKELKAMGATQPIVAITANAMAHDIERYRKVGFDDHLTKPIVRKQLIEIISRYFKTQIDHQSMEQALDQTDKQDLRDEFIARIAGEMAQFENLDASQPERVWQLAHRLTGAAHLLGFKELAQQAAALENVARTNPDAIMSCHATLLVTLRKMLSNHHTDVS